MYCDKYGYPKTNPTNYVSYECPECGKSNCIQWKGKFADALKEHDWLLAIIASVALLASASTVTFIVIGKYIIGLISLMFAIILFGLLSEIIS